LVRRRRTRRRHPAAVRDPLSADAAERRFIARHAAVVDFRLRRPDGGAGRHRAGVLGLGGATAEHLAGVMTLHFAYGANMSRAVMRRHAREARALGVAVLPDHRFVIGADGYASVEPARARQVYGVLWRITPRDRVTLDAWENVEGGLYRAETLPVRH